MHDASTAEWVVAAILAAIREFPLFARSKNPPSGGAITSPAAWPASSPVLIVGYGSMGAAAERRLAGFEVDVARVALHGRPWRGLRELTCPGCCPGRTWSWLLAPATPETVGMADAAFLGRMKDGALLVNAARGSLLRTDALVGELRRGRLKRRCM